MDNSTGYIDISCIKDELATIAYSMFRDWTKHAKLKYKEKDFTIINEQELVKDLYEAICSALIALVQEKEKSKNIPGWSIGFLLGYIEGHLNKLWSHEYIVKTEENYKQYVLLGVIKNFLMGNDDFILNKISAIYKQQLAAEVNLLNVDTDIANFIINTKSRELEQKKETFENGDIEACINALLSEKLVKILDEDNKFLNPIDHYFSNEICKELINKNKFIG